MTDGERVILVKSADERIGVAAPDQAQDARRRALLTRLATLPVVPVVVGTLAATRSARAGS